MPFLIKLPSDHPILMLISYHVLPYEEQELLLTDLIPFCPLNLPLKLLKKI